MESDIHDFYPNYDAFKYALLICGKINDIGQ